MLEWIGNVDVPLAIVELESRMRESQAVEATLQHDTTSD